MIRSGFIRPFIVLFSIYAVSPLSAALHLNEDPHIDRGHLGSRCNQGLFAVELVFSRIFGLAEEPEGEPDNRQILKKKRFIPVKISKDYGTDRASQQETHACLPQTAVIPLNIAYYSIDSSGTRAAPDSGHRLIFSGLSPPSA